MATMEPITSLDDALALSASRTFLAATECAQRFVRRLNPASYLLAEAKGSRVAITVSNVGNGAVLKQVFESLVSEMSDPKVKAREKDGELKMYVNVRNFMTGFTPALYRQWSENRPNS